MLQMQLMLAWVHVRFDDLRKEHGHEAGFTTLEWVVIAGIVLVIAAGVGTLLSKKASDATNSISPSASIANAPTPSN